MAQAARKQDELFEDDIVEMPADAWAKIETLKGDMRDAMIDWFKRKQTAWKDQNGYDQKTTIDEIDLFAKKLVHQSARLIAARGFDAVPITISKFTVDPEKGIQATFTMSRTDENLVTMNDCLGTAVQLVPVDTAEFNGERKPAKPDVIGELKLPNPEVDPPKQEETPHDPETGEVIEEKPGAAEDATP